MPEVEPIWLEPVDALTVTTLVDNVTDILLGDGGPARRPPIARVPASVLIDGEAFDALRAEHGFAALVTVTRAGRQHRVLFDTGISPDGLVENMRRLELSPRDVEVIVLSHGHFDHVGGLEGLARELGPANLPVVIHPEAWSRRRLALPGRDPAPQSPAAKPARTVEAGLLADSSVEAPRVTNQRHTVLGVAKVLSLRGRAHAHASTTPERVI